MRARPSGGGETSAEAEVVAGEGPPALHARSARAELRGAGGEQVLVDRLRGVLLEAGDLVERRAGDLQRVDEAVETAVGLAHGVLQDFR